MKPSQKTTLDMTPVLENEFILTRAMNRRYAKITYQKYHSKWQIVTLITAIVLFAAAFASAFASKFVPFLVFLFPILLLAGFYVFFMSWFGYLFQASVSYKDMARFYGDPVKMHVIFYDRFMRVVGDGNFFDFMYSQITDMTDLEDMIILTVNAKGSIAHGQVIDKSLFTPEQLIKFYSISEKFGKIE